MAFDLVGLRIQVASSSGSQAAAALKIYAGHCIRVNLDFFPRSMRYSIMLASPPAREDLGIQSS